MRCAESGRVGRCICGGLCESKPHFPSFLAHPTSFFCLSVLDVGVRVKEQGQEAPLLLFLVTVFFLVLTYVLQLRHYSTEAC